MTIIELNGNSSHLELQNGSHTCQKLLSINLIIKMNKTFTPYMAYELR